MRDASGHLRRNPDGSLVFGLTSTRWVGTGRVIYDNKANPVKAYEPFFDSSPVYDDETDLVEWGVTAITRYDPLSRAIRVDNPDGTYRTVEFGPWHQVSSDENDTVLGSAWYAARRGAPPGSDEADAAAKAAAHANTPGRADLDTLGRTFRTVADNGDQGQYPTVLALDIEGQVRATTDALGRVVLTQDYHQAGAEIHRASVDAGERWLLPDAAGQHLLGWDSRGQQIRATYDELRRPTGLYVTAGPGPERLAEQVAYGETLTLADAQARNLRGAAYQHFDEAGRAATAQRDFQGNVLTATRQLLGDYRGDVDWAQDPPLETEIFTTATTYDALSRPVTVTTPDGSITSQAFNERSLLAGVTVSLATAAGPADYVTGMAYDAKGQRQRLLYGNGAVSTYAYDPDTFRLTGLSTIRASGPGPLQDLSYTYDPVGNVTRLKDAAQQKVFFANQVVTPDADYTYDAIYRLTIARGREHRGQAGQPQTTWDDGPRVDVPLPTDSQAMRTYQETYAYDPVGNFRSVVHTGDNGNWTRNYSYGDPATNRLTSTAVGSATDRYRYDGNGNVTAMPHLALMQWNWKDELHATALQASTTPVTYYRYDATGQRARKVTDSQVTGSQKVTLVRQRIYLGGYEVYREYSPAGALTLERQSLHIGDGTRIICLAETTISTGNPVTLDRYQLGNHLGSAVLELDDTAAIITYEEYYPYGSTSFQTGRTKAEVSLKRYRYTGKERDEESGFSYHDARYYAAWLGRWISAERFGIGADGVNCYDYCRASPVIRKDPRGDSSEITEADVVKMATDILDKYNIPYSQEVPYIVAGGVPGRHDLVIGHGGALQVEAKIDSASRYTRAQKINHPLIRGGAQQTLTGSAPEVSVKTNMSVENDLFDLTHSNVSTDFKNILMTKFDPKANPVPPFLRRSLPTGEKVNLGPVRISAPPASPSGAGDVEAVASPQNGAMQRGATSLEALSGMAIGTAMLGLNLHFASERANEAKSQGDSLGATLAWISGWTSIVPILGESTLTLEQGYQAAHVMGQLFASKTEQHFEDMRLAYNPPQPMPEANPGGILEFLGGGFHW